MSARARITRCLLAVAAVFVPTAASAQTIDELVARHIAARGGRDALAAVRTVRMAGRAIAGPGREARVRRETARPGRIRTEFVFQGTTGVYAWDGTAGWRISPLDGALDPEPLGEDAAALAAEQADFDGPLVDWKAKGNAVELLGQDPQPDGPAQKLKVTLKTGAVRYLWLDATTGLLVRSELARKLRGRDLTFETVFGDYKETGGVRFPRKVETGVRGRPQRLRIVVDSVETNVPIDDSRFSFPR
jgi:hypothetical protein